MNEINCDAVWVGTIYNMLELAPSSTSEQDDYIFSRESLQTLSLPLSLGGNKSKQNDIISFWNWQLQADISKSCNKKNCFWSPRKLPCFTRHGPMGRLLFLHRSLPGPLFRDPFAALEGNYCFFRCSSHSDSRRVDGSSHLSIHSLQICWGSNHHQNQILTLKNRGYQKMNHMNQKGFFGCCLTHWWNTWMTEPKQNGNT